MNILYRISNNSYNKNRLPEISKIDCLNNLLFIFNKHKVTLFLDNVTDEFENELIQGIKFTNYEIIKINAGSNAKSFNTTLDYALNLDPQDIVYFVEDDYTHLPNSSETIEEGLNYLGADFITLYLHPDKFIPNYKGGNPGVDDDGGYLTKIYRGSHNLWGIFDSTTMTFACKVKTLLKYEDIIRYHTSGNHPNDYQMFKDLKEEQCILLCPLNTYSTHNEIEWLAPVKSISKKELIEYWKDVNLSYQFKYIK